MEGYLGIDVSKGYADFVLLDERHKELESNFQLDDNREGHCTLEAVLSDLIQTHGLESLKCGVESTGGYENNWYWCLQGLSARLPVQVSRLNPRGVNAQWKADLGRNVTDKISASCIASYLIRYPKRVRYHQEDPVENFQEMRSLYRFIEMLTKQKGQLSNQLEKLLYKAFPELLRYCRNGYSAWVLKLLLRYPTAKRAARATLAGICKVPYVAKAKARKIHSLARESTASSSSVCTEATIMALAGEILNKLNLIAAQKKVLQTYCQSSQRTLMESIPGIGAFSACAMFIEIEDVSRFAKAGQLASYFGLHPVYKDSGDSQKGYRMSKMGRSTPRKVLYMSGMVAIRKSAHLKGIYHRHRKNGKNHYSAMGVIMHKLLRIIFGVLRTGTLYCEQVDIEYQKKTPRQNEEKAKEKSKKDPARRFQKRSEEEAPISRRNAQKRRSSSSPQSTKDGTSGIPKETPPEI